MGPAARARDTGDMGWNDDKGPGLEADASGAPLPASDSTWAWDSEREPVHITWQLDDPNALWYTEAVESGNWREVRDVLMELEPATRTSLLARQDFTVPPTDCANAWVRGAPYDSYAFVFRGWDRLHTARGRRPDGPNGVPTSPDTLRYVNDVLAAEADFDRALALEDDLLTAQIGLVATATSLRVPGEEIIARYEAADQKTSPIPSAAQMVCRGLSPGQGGRADLMFAFAHLVARNAPVGSALPACVAVAFLEEARTEGSYARLARPEARAGLKEAASRSIFNTAFVPDMEGRMAANLFAGAFWFGQHRSEAARALEVADGWYHVDPWRTVAEPTEYIQWVEYEVGRPLPWQHPFL